MREPAFCPRKRPPVETFSADRVIGVLAAGWLLHSRCWNVVRVERPQHQKGAAMNYYAGLDVSVSPD